MEEVCFSKLQSLDSQFHHVKIVAIGGGDKGHVCSLKNCKHCCMDSISLLDVGVLNQMREA